MRDKIFRNVKNEEEKNQQKQRYAEYVENTFLGEHPDVFKGSLTGYKRLSMEAWFTTYFTASVISESARNFRTFPLTLMALDLVRNNNDNTRQKGRNFSLTIIQ